MFFGLLKKKYLLPFILVILAITIVLWLGYLPVVSYDSLSLKLDQSFEQKIIPIVKINDLEIPVDLATTSEAVQKGLSGRSSLDQDKGMLFIFDKPSYYRFWMPDMNFPIDIIWIERNQVVGIEENISNNFNSVNPVFYTPPEPVSRVLEVNAGFVSRNEIKIGDPVIVENFN